MRGERLFPLPNKTNGGIYMAFDYTNSVTETIVAEGVEGKIIMVYGGNNLGKSKSSTEFPKSVTLPFEPNALNAIGGAKQLPVHNWATFVDFVESVYKDKIAYEKDKAALERLETKELPKDKTEKEAMEQRIARLQEKVNASPYIVFKNMFSTLVVDSLTALGKSAEKYVTDEAEVVELSDGNRGKLYKRFENEVYHVINKFFNLGDFTYLILAHEDFRNIGTEDEQIMQAVPKGDWKRIVKPVIDRCDIVAYLKSNGMDENHRVIPSSAILGECNLCFARTKWDNMKLYLPEYSAQNLQDVIAEAINEQKSSGVKVGSFKDQQKSFVESLTVDYNDIKNKIGELVTTIYQHDNEDMEGENMIKYQTIVSEFLGDKKVSETNEKQVGQLTNILSRTQDLVDSLR